ncbi:MAG TPA: hypothetical protein VFS40_03600 [Gemmatimonadales bacterium]|nr:hypothetical protein [Gemmatimonadales bacterium]
MSKPATHVEGEVDGRPFTAELREAETGTRGLDGHPIGSQWHVTFDGITRPMDNVPDATAEWAMRDHVRCWLEEELREGRWHPEA